MMKERDRYLKIVEWSEGDKCYASVPGWIGACCHGDSDEEVFHDLCCIVDDWIDVLRKSATTSEKSRN